MSSNKKCKNCGSTDIEDDNSRGETICTICGAVLQDSIIVNDIQYDSIAGKSLGQFVPSDAVTNIGYGKFNISYATDFNSAAMRKARKGISTLCYQLKLNKHHIETALNFFKMALNKNLTKGRKSPLVYSACVYITCRTEGTSHLLIDISDVLQICCYELGKTYTKLVNALCIKIPSIDPCIYVMRFANDLNLGCKTHEVAMTAIRLVKRMKKDTIHLGRKPTGICGAALLIAARMHNFCRSINDIVKIVKLNPITIKKRLNEFSYTPSSTLTLDDFIAVDLDAEQEPPSFKEARKRDRERLKKIPDTKLFKLRNEVENYLKNCTSNSLKDLEENNTQKEDFEKVNTVENTKAVEDSLLDYIEVNVPNEKLKPEMATIHNENNNKSDNADDSEFDDLDDDDINSYIMSEAEVKYKTEMWSQINAVYLKEIDEQKLAKQKLQDGKREKKKQNLHKILTTSTNINDKRIKGVIEEKRLSNKINYDILNTLNQMNFNTEKEKSEIIMETKSISTTVKLNNKFKTKLKPKNIPTVLKSRNKKAKIETAKLRVVEKMKKETKSDNYILRKKGETKTKAEIKNKVQPHPESDAECETDLKDILGTRNEEEPFYGCDEELY